MWVFFFSVGVGFGCDMMRGLMIVCFHSHTWTEMNTTHTIQPIQPYNHTTIQPYNQVANIRSDALFILLVEKDAAFMRLAEDRFYNTYPCIIVTAKGQPDVATRLFLKKLKQTLNIPVLALVDSDPYGLKILSVYMKGIHFGVLFGWILFGWILFGWILFGWILFGWILFGWILFGWILFGWVFFGVILVLYAVTTPPLTLPGSMNMSYDSSNLTTPDIKWLGVRPSDLDRFNIPQQCRLPMTEEDIKTGKKLV